MEMSRREQDKFERTIALSLADTGRGGVGAGAGVAANDVEAQIIQQVAETRTPGTSRGYSLVRTRGVRMHRT